MFAQVKYTQLIAFHFEANVAKVSLFPGWIWSKNTNKAAPTGIFCPELQSSENVMHDDTITKTGEDKSEFSSNRTLLSVCMCVLCVSRCRLRFV